VRFAINLPSRLLRTVRQTAHAEEALYPARHPALGTFRGLRLPIPLLGRAL